MLSLIQEKMASLLPPLVKSNHHYHYFSKFYIILFAKSVQIFDEECGHSLFLEGTIYTIIYYIVDNFVIIFL